MSGQRSVYYLSFRFFFPSHVAPLSLFTLLYILREVNVGLSPLVSPQHYCHAQPHLNTMKLQLHLIIDMVR